MSANASRAKDVVKLDVETTLNTIEARKFLNQISLVSRVLSMRDTEVEFKGEEIAATGYVGDCKSVQLFKCPNGFFLFCNKAFTKNNWSAAARTLEEVLQQIDDDAVRAKVSEELSTEAAAA